MKAIICTRPGPPEVLQLQEVPQPAPRADEVLIKIHAGSVTAGDVLLRTLTFPLTLVFRLFGTPRKEIAGHELAGEVEAVGPAVRRFQPGDQVFGTTTGLRVGGNAQYVCLPAEGGKGVLAHKPGNLSWGETAVLPVGGMTALYLLNKAAVRPGQKALIYGASGSVGTYAVQLARHFGAEVTGVCSARNAALVHSLGATQVIDYTSEDFTRSCESYDVIMDAVGKISAAQAKGLLAPGGAFVSVQSSTREKIENLVLLKELAEAGAIRPVLDRCYPLEETAAAHHYVATGRKAGNVAITIAHEESARS